MLYCFVLFPDARIGNEKVTLVSFPPLDIFLHLISLPITWLIGNKGEFPWLNAAQLWISTVQLMLYGPMAIQWWMLLSSVSPGSRSGALDGGQPRQLGIGQIPASHFVSFGLWDECCSWRKLHFSWLLMTPLIIKRHLGDINLRPPYLEPKARK